MKHKMWLSKTTPKKNVISSVNQLSFAPLERGIDLNAMNCVCNNSETEHLLNFHKEQRGFWFYQFFCHTTRVYGVSTDHNRSMWIKVSPYVCNCDSLKVCIVLSIRQNKCLWKCCYHIFIYRILSAMISQSISLMKIVPRAYWTWMSPDELQQNDRLTEYI